MVSDRRQSDENADDEDQMDSNNKKNSQNDLTQRRRTDFRSTSKGETGKMEKITIGTKRKALNSRSGKHLKEQLRIKSSSLDIKLFCHSFCSRQFK